VVENPIGMVYFSVKIKKHELSGPTTAGEYEKT
jgi:hypothetical protein